MPDRVNMSRGDIQEHSFGTADEHLAGVSDYCLCLILLTFLTFLAHELMGILWSCCCSENTHAPHQMSQWPVVAAADCDVKCEQHACCCWLWIGAHLGPGHGGACVGRPLQLHLPVSLNIHSFAVSHTTSWTTAEELLNQRLHACF